MDEASLVARIKAAEETNECQGVVDAMREGASNASVAEDGCSALWVLANSNNNKRIGEAGGIAMILSMMEEHGESNADVVKNGCGALSNLACNAQNKRNILAANGVSIVERMKSTWASNEGVQAMADGALAILRN